MATIKSFTSLEQSKKLAKFLPLESADMCCFKNPNGCINYYGFPFLQGNKDSNPIPCWSLASLLSIIRETIGYTIYGVNNVYMSCDLGDEPWKLETEVYDNEVDACVAMVESLHELNLL